MNATSFYNRPTFTVTPIAHDPEKADVYMRFSDNLSTLRNRDRVAYDAIVARMDEGGETWQSLDADVCHEIERLTALADQFDISAMRRGE